MQKIIKSLASLIGVVLIVPLIQAPAAKLAEKLGFDTVYTKRWDSLSDIAQNPWYTFAFGCIIGIALTLWIVALFPEKNAGIPRASRSVSPTFFSPLGRYIIGWVNIYKLDEKGVLLPPESVRQISQVSKIVKVKTIIPWLYYRIELTRREINAHVFFKRSPEDTTFDVAAFGDMPFY